MRWLCILLLLANVGYFGWELNQRLYGQASGEATAAPPPLPAGVPQLRLLSELDRLPPTRDLIANPSSAPTSSPSGQTESRSAAASPSSGDTKEAKAAAAAKQTTPASGSSNAAETAKPSGAAEADKPAVAETAAASPAKAESAKTTVPPTAPANTEVAESAAPSTETDVQCLRLGPFDSEAQAGMLRDRYASRSRSIAVTKSTRQEQKFFWVYLEAVSSDAQAKERLEDLKSKGIKDLFMVRKGEMKNAVSLGVFRSQESVRNRLAELKNRGYQPLVVPRYETKTEYWLDLRGDPDQLSVDELSGELPVAVKASAVDCSAAGAGTDAPDQTSGP